MKRLIVLLIIGIVLLGSGCTSKDTTTTPSTTAPPTTIATTTTSPSSTTPTTTTTTTTTTPTKTYAPIDFKTAKTGEILSNWYDLFDSSVIYASPELVELARHYFPDSEIRPINEFQSGIAILSPKDGRALLRGKPMLVTVDSYFGYVSYRTGYKYFGENVGMMVVYKEDGMDRLIFTGNGPSGIGAALEYAMELKEGRSVNPMFVAKRGDFRGIMVKVIGDNDWDGVKDEGEFWTLKDFAYEEPVQFYWRVVDGTNVTVSGGFIRMVNGSTVYIRALGFDVSVDVDEPGKPITYVVENTNPDVLELPDGAERGDTWVRFTSTDDFELKAKPIGDYRILAFGDHRPGGGTAPPKPFLKIVEALKNESGLFIIDGGDLVYSGRMNEWAALMKVWDFNRPIFLASGNHEYQGEGKAIYHKLFGPTDYSFALGRFYYIFVDNTESGYRLSSAQWAWLEEELKRASELGLRPVVVMHAPPFDPRPGEHHAMRDADGERLMSLMKTYNAFGIFSHIHMFWFGKKDGVEVLVTGGGGAPLYVPEEEGGYYHYVRLDMLANGTVRVEPVRVG
ncbi:metallophosphoesterase family protein [Palaeococcus ferrophilus]|uniref:metallophosphoesterase family protein n=1 Tax=Palaeococcus ferrophilus TaxID=83868 RepID=UPI00064F2D33|nr:metallophosphoesterase [Palaeococcus ferrophilus]